MQRFVSMMLVSGLLGLVFASEAPKGSKYRDLLEQQRTGHTDKRELLSQQRYVEDQDSRSWTNNNKLTEKKRTELEKYRSDHYLEHQNGKCNCLNYRL